MQDCRIIETIHKKIREAERRNDRTIPAIVKPKRTNAPRTNSSFIFATERYLLLLVSFPVFILYTI